MDETHKITLSERSQTQKNILCDSIYVKFRNEQKSSVEMEIEIVVILGCKEGVVLEGGTRSTSGVLVISIDFSGIGSWGVSTL